MTIQKKRRVDFRQFVKEQRGDRFDDMMRTVIGGGSAPCVCCTVVWPASSLRDGLCGGCRSSLGRIRAQRPISPVIARELGDFEVWVDASFRDGVAGLAVLGALGRHSCRTDAATSTHAEVLALTWAMELADGIRDLTFFTDCQAAHICCVGRGSRLGWNVQLVSRRLNAQADRMAWAARVLR